jgi:hypothetical protein
MVTSGGKGICGVVSTLDMGTWTWAQPQLQGPAPHLAPHIEGCLLGKVLGEDYSNGLSTNGLSITEPSLEPRYATSLAFDGEGILIFGGLRRRRTAGVYSADDYLGHLHFLTLA